MMAHLVGQEMAEGDDKRPTRWPFRRLLIEIVRGLCCRTSTTSIGGVAATATTAAAAEGCEQGCEGLVIHAVEVLGQGLVQGIEPRVRPAAGVEVHHHLRTKRHPRVLTAFAASAAGDALL